MPWVDTWGGTLPGPAGGGGVPCQVQLGGVPCRGYPARGYPVGYPLGQDGGYPFRVSPGRVPTPHIPPPTRSGWGGTLLGGGTQLGQQKGVLTTWRTVCLLRSRRRTFLLQGTFAFASNVKNGFCGNK